MANSSVFFKLGAVQNDLKAPKNQTNNFGGYKYRSAEDILQAAKPLCIANGLVLTLSDAVELVGERFYIKATATVTEAETGAQIMATAYAREPATKKGSDESQITGMASSYARKYALNGLFAIDDTKDADTDEYHKQTHREGTKEPAHDVDYEAECRRIFAEAGIDPTWVLALFEASAFDEKFYKSAINAAWLNKIKEKYAEKGEKESKKK